MSNHSAGARHLVRLGHIAGVHGVRGWVRIHSLTEPREAILDYQPWLLGDEQKSVEYNQAKEHGKKLIALFDGIKDRDAAEALIGTEIFVLRDQLPELSGDSWYWSDLIGLSVQLESGEVLGTLDNMMATGANDVMVVKGSKEYLVPFVLDQYVKNVDLEAGRITVDWDPDF